MDDNSQNAASILAALEALKKPVGVGPVASGDNYGQMLEAIRRGSGAVQAVKSGTAPVVTPVAPQSPSVNTFIAPSKDVNIPADAPSQQEAAFIESRLTGKPQKPAQGIRQEKMAEDVGMIPESPSAATTPEESQAAMDMVDQQPIAPEVKEEVKNNIANQDQLKDKDPQKMTLPEKLAIIAMAVAPTVVGYAAHGTKGAYLGAASSGKGLAAGLEEAKDQDKMAIEKAKALKTAAAVEKSDKIITDEQGNMFFQNEANKLSPVINPSTGQQMRQANVEITGYDEANQPFKRMKFEQPKETAQAPGRVGAAVMFNDIVTTAKEKNIKGVNLSPDMRAFASKYPDYSPRNEQPPQGVDKASWDSDRKLFLKQIADAEKKLSPEKPKTPSGAPTIQQRAEMDLYKDEVKKWAGDEWKAFRNEATAAEMFFNRSTNEIKSRGVADAALWFDYMKKIQQDQSVVREGDVATAMRFMSTKQRIDSLLSQYGPNLGSQMTDGLRKEIIDFLGEIRKIKEKQAMMDMNNMVRKGMTPGISIPPERTLLPSTAKSEAIKWASSRLASAPVLGMAAGTPIWKKRIPEMAQAGELKNGQFVRDTDGDPYLIDFFKRPDGKIGVRAIYWAVK